MKPKLARLFLSWVNEFVTVEGFASHYGLTRETALRVISLGRKIHENRTRA